MATRQFVWWAVPTLRCLAIDGRHATIQELLRQKTEWLAAIERMASRINNAAKTTGLV